MKNKISKVFIYICLFNIFKAICYYVAKLTPFKATLIGSIFDKNIPLYSIFVWFYVIWYLTLIFIPFYFYKKDKEKFYQYLSLDLICLIFDFTIYILYPTFIERPEVLGSGFSDYILKLVYYFDTPACNCFPSEHCVLCFLFIYVALIGKKFKMLDKLFIIILSSLIILSTLFVHQHVIADVVAALFIVIVAILINMIFKFDKKLFHKFEKDK